MSFWFLFKTEMLLLWTADRAPDKVKYEFLPSKWCSHLVAFLWVSFSVPGCNPLYSLFKVVSCYRFLMAIFFLLLTQGGPWDPTEPTHVGRWKPTIWEGEPVHVERVAGINLLVTRWDAELPTNWATPCFPKKAYLRSGSSTLSWIPYFFT